MIVWWVTEAIPIYITAFLPILLFPTLGILNSAETSVSYGHNYVLMLLGAFILAKGIEKQMLHRRLAFWFIRRLGTNKRIIILGFMLITAFLSMWITNMAVVLIMLPIAVAMIDGKGTSEDKKFGLALLLGIAYAASIGGTGTLIGSPTNLVLAGLLEELSPNLPSLDFLKWMTMGLPVVLIFIPLTWVFLVLFFRIKKDKSIVIDDLGDLGKISSGEQRISVIFLLTALGWVFRKNITIGAFSIPGWSNWLNYPDYMHDSTVAFLGAILLFITPNGKGGRLMNWNLAKDIPWGVAMFLGGGLALGKAFGSTGLAVWIGNKFTALENIPVFLLIVLIVCFIIFLTEVNSNTATATIFLPILAAIAVSGGINPLLVMVPATFACSFAFMLPSGTGTNTVIFASERLRIGDMAKTGFWLNLISIIALPLLLYYVVLPILGIH
ncbi:SLC13 family permease [Flavobacteriaceae bacterium GF1]